MCIAQEEKKCLDNHQNPTPFFFSCQYHIHMINLHLLLITFFCYVFMSLGQSSSHIFIHLMIRNKELKILLKNNNNNKELNNINLEKAHTNKSANTNASSNTNNF